MSDEAWIEQSLARLEELETQKAQLEADDNMAKLAEVEAEISDLYQQLEAVASDDPAEASHTAAVAAATPASDPFGAPAAAEAEAPFSAPAAEPAPFSPPAPAAAPPEPDFAAEVGFDDSDVELPRSRTPLYAAIAVVMLGVAGGGYYMATQNKPEPEPKEPSAPKVISASSVPEDTQDPGGAKGADVDRTPGTEISESSKPRSGGGKARPNNGGGKQRKKRKDNGNRVQIEDSNDPLAGVR